MVKPGTHLIVAGYQMAVSESVEENVGRIYNAIHWAAENGSEILLTPEGSLSGYTHQFDQKLVKEGLEHVLSQARARHVGLALGTCFVEDDGRRYNQIRFYRPDGEYLGFHSKILRTGSMAKRKEGEIVNFATSPLRVFPWRDGIVMGGLICNDLWANPECTPMPDSHLSQKLVKMGVNIIFHAVNGGRDASRWSAINWKFHEANLQMRAHSGNVWIVTVDSATPIELPCSAPSGVITPTGEFIVTTKPIGDQLFTYEIVFT